MSNNPAAVPKPSTAGTAQTAIANTRQAFVNIRNGPGTQYADIGDLRNFTLVAYFPATRTSDGWVWIEQFETRGWVSSTYVNFEIIAGRPPITAQSATPYDNQVAIWHWKGDSVSENTIDDVALTIKNNAPSITQVWVKISDYTASAGAQWMGYWDTKRALAIDGPQSVDRWVTGLAKHNLEFHAWCVPKGGDITAETNIIIQACRRAGVKSLILDVEPYAGFWLGGQAAIRPFMLALRRGLPSTFHIGLCIDPRSHHFSSIFPAEWAPFVNSVHPMVYWETMRRQPDDILKETYQVWGSYGKPIIPALQGDAEALDMENAFTLSTQRHSARGVSWWRLGVMGPVEFRAANRQISGSVVTPPTTGGPIYVDEQLIKPNDAGYTVYTHTGRNEMSSFAGTWGWDVKYKQTESVTSKVVVRWAPHLTQNAKYEIAAFVPARHATTTNARYKLHGVKGTAGELLVTLNQDNYRNQWVSLGVFELDINNPNAGQVYLNDLTGEAGKEIAFDAIRWRRVSTLPNDGTPIPAGYADGYDVPVGTLSERQSGKVWPGSWLDASPFGRLYFVGTPSEAYHTGADLNLPRDADAHSPVYASASGIVVFASRLPTWGNVVIIKHDPLARNGMVMYGRYAHVESMAVKVGDRVKRGQQIADVGNAFGRWAYHLHFDLSPTTILESNPSHWPAKNRDELFKHYVDPREFILNNRP